MYGLHDSASAVIIQVSCFYVLQNVIPATILITTRKGSPLRYLCIPSMIWIASRFVHPFGSSRSPAWCQAVTQLIIATFQAMDLLLINHLDAKDISHGEDNLRHRFVKAVRLIAQTRAINTPWQVKNVPSHPKYYIRRGGQVPSRRRFLLRQLSIVLWQYLVLDIVQLASSRQTLERESSENVTYTAEWVSPVGQWAERIFTHLSIWLLVNRLIVDLVYRFLSIIFVGIFKDSPSDWPPAFGSMVELTTLRGFWGHFWHQFMRRPFTSVSNYVARNVLSLPRSSILERYTNLFIVFFISAVFHVFVDILQSIPMEKSGSMPFYLAFVLGIMLEDGVQEVWKRTGCPDGSREATVHHSTNIMSFWKRAIGFIWVTIWLGATSTWYFTPMTQSATGDLHMVPLSVANHLGLEPLVGVILIYGAVIVFIFEVEI